MKTSMKIYPNQRKKSTKNSKIPFYLRIIHNGKKSEARLNVSEISEEYLKKWSQETQRFNMKLSREIESIRLLNNKFQFFENRFNLLLNSQTKIDFPSKLRNYILERDEFSNNKEVISFYNILNNHFKKRILTDQELSIGTKKNKRKALNHLQNFLSFKNMIESTEKEFNAHDFLDYLISNHGNKKPMKKVSAKAIIKDIKTLINDLIRRKELSINPFLGQTIKIKHQIQPTLTPSEFCAIRDFNCSSKLMVYKDLFLVMCYTGLSYTDIQDLEPRKIKDGEIEIQRNKSSIITRQYLPKQALNIFKKYSNHIETNIYNRVIPKRSLDKMNLNLKLISAKCSIEHNLSTKYARRFFRASLNKADIREPNLVKTMMGHSIHKDMDKHYLFVDNKMLLEAKEKLELYFNNLSTN